MQREVAVKGSQARQPHKHSSKLEVVLMIGGREERIRGGRDS